MGLPAHFQPCKRCAHVFFSAYNSNFAQTSADAPRLNPNAQPFPFQSFFPAVRQSASIAHDTQESGLAAAGSVPVPEKGGHRPQGVPRDPAKAHPRATTASNAVLAAAAAYATRFQPFFSQEAIATPQNAMPFEAVTTSRPLRSGIFLPQRAASPADNPLYFYNTQVLF